MFNFLKKIFKQEEAVEEAEEVRVENIESWFDSRVGKIVDELDASIRDINSKIKAVVEKTRNDLGGLERAELRNKNIPLRANQFMQGNRESYIKRINVFLDNIDLPENHGSADDFCIQFNKELDGFGKATARPYHILQEFFAHESGVIAQDVKVLNDIVKEMMELMFNSKIKNVEELRSAVKYFTNKINQKKELKENLLRMVKELKDKEKEREDLAKKLDDLKKSEKFSELEKLKEKKEEIRHGISEKEDEILHLFSVIDPALRKYERMAIDNLDLLKKYIDKPLVTLTSDFDFKISAILEAVKQAILKENIDLKDKKKEKVLAAIDELNKAFLEDFLTKYGTLKKEEIKVANSIEDNETQANYDALMQKSEAMKDEFIKMKRDAATVKEEANKIDTDEMKSRVGEDLEKFFGTKISLVL